MLGKLFKYDFKWINKVMIIYFIIAFILTILVKIVESFEMTIIVTIVDKIVSGLLISCFFSTLITCLIRIWVRFKTNIYKDESYLTHTLPVTKSQIFNSKILASILSIIISTVVVILCILISFLNTNTIEVIKSLFNELSNLFGKANLIGMIIAIVCVVILEIIYMMQSGIFGIIVGNKANNHKTLRTVLIGIMIYSIFSGLTLIVLYIIAQFNPNLMELYSKDIPSPEAIQSIIYISLIIYLGYNILLYFASKKILKKGVNVD